jgi:hypothetical protein
MGKTHSKHLAARHGRGTAWERHGICESAFIWLQLHMQVRHCVVMILQPAQKGDIETCNWITKLMWHLYCRYCVCQVMSTTCVAR